MLTPAQHKIRAMGIGGSEAACALGLDPYKQPIELYLEKRGELEREDLSDNERVLWGNLLETVIANEYSLRTNNKVHRVNSTIRHPKYDFMLASIDRRVVGEKRGLECKNVDKHVAAYGEWGEAGSEEVPETYALQCQQYMAVYDYPVWDLAALIGGNELRIYHLERDKELIELMIEQEHEFWQGIEKGELPLIDPEGASIVKTLKRIYPGTNGETIHLDETYLHWVTVQQEANNQIRQYTKIKDGASSHIKAVMGEASRAILPDGGGYERKLIKRKAIEATEYIMCRYKKEMK
jgi:putative phage-type endonuclease